MRHRRLSLVLAAGVSTVVVGLAPAPVRAQAPEAALRAVAAVDVGDTHSCALLTSGQVRCWGDNFVGQLGDGDLGTPSTVPVAVRNVADTGNLTGVTQLAVGRLLACARLATTRVVCWGRNSAGQLGDGSTDDRDTPVVVRNASDTGPLVGVTEVTAGASHACARLANGEARCWGLNDEGQLGNGDAPNDALTARAVRTPSGSAALTGVAEIDAGGSFTCARLTNGQVRCWGGAAQGVLGNDNTVTDRDLPVTVRSTTGSGALSGVSQLAAGVDHACARLSTGQARCWGDNANGPLGDGEDGVDSLVPTIVRNATDTAALTGVTAIDPGENATCARLRSGEARCWGAGTNGVLGHGLLTASNLPVVVRNPADTAALRNVSSVMASTGRHACAVLANAQVRCWGDNDDGQLGNDDAPDDSALPVAVHLG